jgi:hypothetical protein
MKHFANIAALLVLSGSACFAAMGCAAASGDNADDEDILAAPHAQPLGGSEKAVPTQESKEMPSKEQAGEFNKKEPSKEFNKKEPMTEQFNKKEPSYEKAAPTQYSKEAPVESQIPSSSQFSKKGQELQKGK